eukprot:TRINITY_DN9290_c0_g2_i1.p1 TRINITY_DN9290_c0_g2~~TRINITY_DN9290_c0_g2_i1.p1  ORF type:complete len:259 (-),score=36.04 TRINITY_DN9290_c0_g2_i1:178-954(-)
MGLQRSGCLALAVVTIWASAAPEDTQNEHNGIDDTAVLGRGKTMKISGVETGTEFTECISITDFKTKSPFDEVKVIERDMDSGCCPSGFTPGAQHRNEYLSAMIECGWKDDGAIETNYSNCSYGKCFIVPMDFTCSDSKRMTLNGCCADGQDLVGSKQKWCKMGVNDPVDKSEPFSCRRYQSGTFVLENTADVTDDVEDGKLQVHKLQHYTDCPSSQFSGAVQRFPLVLVLSLVIGSIVFIALCLCCFKNHLRRCCSR